MIIKSAIIAIKNIDSNVIINCNTNKSGKTDCKCNDVGIADTKS